MVCWLSWRQSLFIYFFNVCIFVWLCCMFAAACGPSLLEVRGDYSLVAVHGFLIAETSPCRAQTLGAWASLVAAPQTQ